MNILHNQEDAEEVVNDTYLSLWNQIPPKSPDSLSAFIGKITRNLAIKKYQEKTRKKRGGKETTLPLSELELCLPSDFKVEDELDVNNLTQEIDRFLSTLKKEDRLFFTGRYWYIYSVPKIASQFNVSESKVKMSLHRTRKKLKKHLEERGVII